MQKNWKLYSYVSLGDWSTEYITFEKGPYKSKLQVTGLKDCVDCDGLSVTMELTLIVISELEHGSLPSQYPNKRLILTQAERLAIYNEINTIRNRP